MSINYNKYMPYVFGNGRVVLVENKTIDEAIDSDKEILIICNAWSVLLSLLLLSLVLLVFLLPK